VVVVPQSAPDSVIRVYYQAFNKAEIPRSTPSRLECEFASDRLTVILSILADLPVFDKNDRGLIEELRLELDPINQFEPIQKAIAIKALQGLIIKHRAKHCSVAYRNSCG
jgi:hypothetical protein